MFYDIEQAAVQHTIAAADARAAAYEASLGAVGSALASLVGDLENSPVTTAALAGYGNGPVRTAASEITTRTRRALQGGRQALAAYQAGNVTMVSHAGAMASSAPAARDMPGVRR